MGSGESKSGGGEYKSRIYFDPNADKRKGPDYTVKDKHLKTRLMAYIDNESIRNVEIYKQKLGEWQFTKLLFYHAFVVFETRHWWWSIEKNSEGITIQRSKELEYVKAKYRRKNRPDVSFVLKDKGALSMKQLVYWLY